MIIPLLMMMRSQSTRAIALLTSQSSTKGGWRAPILDQENMGCFPATTCKKYDQMMALDAYKVDMIFGTFCAAATDRNFYTYLYLLDSTYHIAKGGFCYPFPSYPPEYV